MNKLTQKERVLIEKKLPHWIDAIGLVKNGQAHVVIITIRAFERDEADLMYMALQYAHEENVQVMFAPLSKANIMQEELIKNEKHIN